MTAPLDLPALLDRIAELERTVDRLQAESDNNAATSPPAFRGSIDELEAFLIATSRPDFAPLDLSALRAKAESATPGPWGWFFGSVENLDEETVARCDTDSVLLSAVHEANARFIAAANPATVLALLDRLEELENHVVPDAVTDAIDGLDLSPEVRTALHAIHAELTVSYANRIAALESGLREACDEIESWVQSETQCDDYTNDQSWKVSTRLRALTEGKL